MSNKKQNWEVIASDYNSPLLRNYIWVSSFFEYPKLLKAPIPILGIISVKNNIEYITDLKSWARTHQALKKRALRDYHFVEKIIEFTHRYGEKMNIWSEKNIFKKNLSLSSNKRLIQLLDRFRKFQSKMYAYGCALPILDFQHFSFVENNLYKYLKEKVNQKELPDYLAIFTESANNSFAQDQEKDLLKLMNKYYQKRDWRRDIQKSNLEYLKKAYPNFYQDIKRHTAKYCWVYYVYNGPEYTEENFIEFMRDYFKKGIIPQKELARLKRYKKELAAKQRQCLAKLKPDKFHRAILRLAGTIIWGKPRRKDYQSKTYYHANKLFQEIARRLHLSLQQIKATPFFLIKNCILKDKPIDVNIINQIYNRHVVLPNKGIKLLYGQKAEDFSINKVKRPKYSAASIHLTKITGACAYSGKVRGLVKIINTVEDMGKMKYGNILVSTATTPSLVPAMKKAAGFVTDEGGLTCHAAIVAREMKKPCIIGTKIATKVFKDGDKVEVDAKRGVVRKIISLRRAESRRIGGADKGIVRKI